MFMNVMGDLFAFNV